MKAAQRTSQTDIYKGDQRRLDFGLMTMEEELRQATNAKAREKTKAKHYEQDFYVLDTETFGLETNELV